MDEDMDEPKSEGDEEKPPKKKAEDNPWYLLATLYDTHSVRKRAENRRAWNRYFATNLDPETRAKLIAEKRHPADELTPLLFPEKTHEVEEAFAKRCKGSVKALTLPESAWPINFRHVQFDKPVTFEGFLFPDCSFEGAVFSSEVNALFNKATFSKWISFKNATFYGGAYFNHASFPERDSPAKKRDFSGAIFKGAAFFEDAAFAGKVNFNGTMFSGEARFSAASFSRLADFADATFSGPAYFNGATFSYVKFDGQARFDKDVNFDDATFTGETNFTNAIFAAQSTFVNAKIKFDTSFKGVTFKTKTPKFFGAELHEGTVWPNREEKAWPIPKKTDEAKNFILAYERLKLEMNRLQKHEDELDFFALELQSRGVDQGPVYGLPIAIYGFLSDYGRSYARPLFALFTLAAFGAAMFRHFGALTLGEASGLSVANTFNVFGFRKDFFDARMIECLPAGLKVVAAIQTTLGTILLFLFGLGIRNKFRMK